MPKFTQDELEEIRKNTDQIEEARKEKASKKKKKTSKSKSRSSRKQKDYSLQERLIPLLLLAITIFISYLVVLFF